MKNRVKNHEELNWRQIDALDREKTVFILPVGMVEQHGPHLPVGLDTFGSEWSAAKLARIVTERLPDWEAVILPTVKYSAQTIEEYVEDKTFMLPGSIPIRWEVVRDYLIDIGSAVAKWGFKYIVMVTAHSEEFQNKALDEVAIYVSEKYGIKMFRPGRLILPAKEAEVPIPRPPERKLPWGVGGHGGVQETEFIMAEFPALLDVGMRKELKPILQGGWPSPERREVYKKAKDINWQGYFGDPTLADWDYAYECKKINEYPWALQSWMAEEVVRILEGEELVRKS